MPILIKGDDVNACHGQLQPTQSHWDNLIIESQIMESSLFWLFTAKESEMIKTIAEKNQSLQCIFLEWQTRP